LARMITDDGVSGITTNPAIFHKAIADGRYYEDDLTALRREALDAETRYERMAIVVVQRACDLLLPVWDGAQGNAGYVSLEVSPALAHDALGTIAAGECLARAVERPNLLFKVPATAAGLVAIEGLVARGISVNVMLMFLLAHVDAVGAAYARGIRSL